MLRRRLITRRYIIRRFAPSDRDFLAAIYKKRKYAARYVEFPDKMKTPDGVLRLLDTVCALYDRAMPIHTYAVALRAYAAASDEQQTYIGSCGFAPNEDGSIQFEWDDYDTEPQTAFISYVRSKDNEAQLAAYVDKANEWSTRIAQELGLSDDPPPMSTLMMQKVLQLSPNISEAKGSI